MNVHVEGSHYHGANASLDPDARASLQRGLTKLLAMTEGLVFRPLRSELYPLPLCMAVYGAMPDPDTVRDQVNLRLDADPVAALEAALVLLELYETNQAETAGCVPDDAAFLEECFGSKRLNGWIATLGDGNLKELEAAVNARWQFKFLPGRERRTGVYPLLNMLMRYGFVYGRVPPGDSHAMGHFIEDFTPGLLVCHGRLDDLELTISLAAMKLGVPAVVPRDYPFPFGRRVQAGSLDEIRDAVVAFPNILNFPNIEIETWIASVLMLLSSYMLGAALYGHFRGELSTGERLFLLIGPVAFLTYLVLRDPWIAVISPGAFALFVVYRRKKTPDWLRRPSELGSIQYSPDDI